jgi:hypothetical protein
VTSTSDSARRRARGSHREILPNDERRQERGHVDPALWTSAGRAGLPGGADVPAEQGGRPPGIRSRALQPIEVGSNESSNEIIARSLERG